MSNRFKLSSEQMERADRLYKESIVIDCLSYMPDLEDPRYLKEMRDAGITGAHLTWTSPADRFRPAVERICAWLNKLEEYRDFAVLAHTAEDILKAKRENKVAIIAGMQNAKPIDDDLKLVRAFHRLGIRIIQAAYHYTSYIGSGCGERNNYGLSRFGINVVQEMNRLGILVDASHIGPATVADIIEYSVKPIAFTHANPKHFGDHIRNKSDDLIKACAKKGGVVGVTAWSEHLEPWLGRRPTIEDLLDMIDYLVKLVGEDHVGFGFDLTPQWKREGVGGYDEFGRIYPEMFKSNYAERNFEGLTDVHCIIDITRDLVARGYSDETIKKINGGNWIRLFKETWDNPAKVKIQDEYIRGGA
jgi:membrane dipeptidase